MAVTYTMRISRFGDSLLAADAGRRLFTAGIDDRVVADLRAQVGLLTPEEIKGERHQLRNDPATVGRATRGGEGDDLSLGNWGLIQSRAMDNLLRLYFESEEVRRLLRQRFEPDPLMPANRIKQRYGSPADSDTNKKCIREYQKRTFGVAQAKNFISVTGTERGQSCTSSLFTRSKAASAARWQSSTLPPSWCAGAAECSSSISTSKHLDWKPTNTCPDKPHPGIVDYVTQFRKTYEVPELLPYLYETKPIGKKGGHLWVMPAGRRDKAYRNALVSLDWKDLYQNRGGFLLFEDTKKGWEQELKPDYVLIDSRSGDTDVLGICTRQLPDSVVLMFTPNEQNLAGLEGVCRDIRHEETEGLKKQIRLHFVAANVPDLDDEKGILQRQIDAIRKRLKFKELSGMIRRYENLNLLDQSVFVLDRRHSRLARDYRKLARLVTADNLADRDAVLHALDDREQYLRTLLEDIGTEREPGYNLRWTLGRAFFKFEEEQIITNFLEDPDVLVKVAWCQALEERFEEASHLLDWVLRKKPDRPTALWKRARAGFDSVIPQVRGTICLITCKLRTLKGEVIVRVGRELRTISPDKLLQAIDLPAVQGLAPKSKIEIIKILASTEIGLETAIKLLPFQECGGYSLCVPCWQRSRSLSGPTDSLPNQGQVLGRGGRPLATSRLGL